MAEAWWRRDDAGIVVSVRVTPGAKRSEPVGVEDGRLRVRIAAPPVDGKANAETQRLLARLFGVRRAAVSLRRGERAREKTFAIAGVERPPDDLPA